MMELTYIGHSGFIVEMDDATLAFDIINDVKEHIVSGDKPLFVFSSHAHGDHYTSKIFKWFDGAYGGRPAEFFLGDDEEVKFKHVPRGENIHVVRGLEKISVDAEGNLNRRELGEASDFDRSLVTIETLHSTDAGVAFLVSVGEKTIFHAGDLAWWDWTKDGGVYDPEEARLEAAETEKDFKGKIAPLKGRHIDLAMLPLDPRLGGTTDWTIEAYDEIADIDKIVPMHQWEKYDITKDFVKSHPGIAEKMVVIEGKK